MASVTYPSSNFGSLSSCIVTGTTHHPAKPDRKLVMFSHSFFVRARVDGRMRGAPSPYELPSANPSHALILVFFISAQTTFLLYGNNSKLNKAVNPQLQSILLDTAYAAQTNTTVYGRGSYGSLSITFKTEVFEKSAYYTCAGTIFALLLRRTK